MAMVVESPIVGAFPESPLDPDEQVFPCKGCGQILEEGKAFELAGNRWHIDCFRCNTCNTLLDSDANLLLLGDGSLICNNCTYSCSSCGNKIEDLAILTGDQAFCANCFKCRNCKKKIENLRYARTSQGIFCMDCHEALMARRRKKTTRNGAPRSKLSSNNNTVLEKSLPAIPPPNSDARKTAYIPEAEEPPEQQPEEPLPHIPSISKTIGELRRGDDPDPTEVAAPVQPMINQENLLLPSTTFRNPRHSMMSQRSEISGDGEFLIPLAFDPNPAPAQSPSISNQATPKVVEERPKDYFTTRSTSQQSVTKSATSSPHIAFQEKGRQPSNDIGDAMIPRKDVNTSRSVSATTSPQMSDNKSPQTIDDPLRRPEVARGGSISKERFMLQEAPKTRRIPSARSSRSEATTPRGDEPSHFARTPISPPLELLSSTVYSTPRFSNENSPNLDDDQESPLPYPAKTMLKEIPKRGDSLEKRSQTIPRKELNASANIPAAFSEGLSVSTGPRPADPEKANGGKVISAPITSPDSQSIFEAPNSPQRSGQVAGAGTSATESFTDPRAPPAPPYDHSRSRNVSVSTQSELQKADHTKSPRLPSYTAGGDFTLDEDMARILGNDEPLIHESFLRRVSHSVRHGRSYSDKSGRLSKDRWPKSPLLPSALVGQEISSPSTASPENREELAWFKNELRRERQKAMERDKRIAELEAQLEGNTDIKLVNSELKEKRSTMVVLDAQKEIVVRELEVLTEHLAAAKSSGEPLDLRKLSNVVLRDFAEQLEKLKTSFAPQIEDYIQKRNDLLAEIANLSQMKDKSFMEFEQLSSKNAQLAELNNQLVHQIQGLYKANSGVNEPVKAQMNGLGIYSHHKDKSQVSLDSRPSVTNIPSDISIPDSATTLQASEAEPITVIQGPHVVNIRKAQPKKFDWRKGGKAVKVLKGAFSSQDRYERDANFAETGAYGSVAAGQEPASGPRYNQDQSKQGFGFFSGGNQRPVPRQNGVYASQQNASTPSLLLDASTHLYGSELSERAEFEKTIIPNIVIRCVEAVESRGMDVEGIYRKSGGNSQVEAVRNGFEYNPGTLDLADPDLDIHAVTSGLKQYFRKLPNPLITYDVYDALLDVTKIPEGPPQKQHRIEAMRRALEQLPRVHYDTLEYLIKHLRQVVERRDVNLMTSMNIAVVFAPTIMRPESLGRELSDTKMKNEVVCWLVEDGDKVFQ